MGKDECQTEEKTKSEIENKNKRNKRPRGVVCELMQIDSSSDNHPHHPIQDLQSHTHQCHHSLPIDQYLNDQVEYHSP